MKLHIYAYDKKYNIVYTIILNGIHANTIAYIKRKNSMQFIITALKIKAHHLCS